MVVFAISVFGTTLPHIFYGESLLNHMNAMQGRGPMMAASAAYHNKSQDMHLGMMMDNGTSSVVIQDLPANLCSGLGMGDALNGSRTAKSKGKLTSFTRVGIN